MQIPKSDKKCVRCGAPAEVHFIDVKCRKITRHKPLCIKCAMKEALPLPTGNTPVQMLGLLASMLDHGTWCRENISTIHAKLKDLTRKDLPAKAAAWKQWLKEHPEEAKVDAGECLQALRELGFSDEYLLRRKEDKLEFLVKVLEHSIECAKNLSTVHAHMKELTGKNLPADSLAWKRWMKEHPEELEVDRKEWQKIFPPLAQVFSFEPPAYVLWKPEPEQP
jgi:hypothetical protein